MQQTYQQFAGFLSPTYPFTLYNPNTGNAQDLTGVNIATMAIKFQSTSGGVPIVGTGSFTVLNASRGQVSYQWTFADMQVLLAGFTYGVYVIAKLSGDVSYEVFYIGTVTLVYYPGGAIVSTQDVNVQQIGSQNVAQTYNGISVPSGVVPCVLVVPASAPAQPISAAANTIADLITLLTSVGLVGDTAWSGSGNGSEIAILKKIVSQLAGVINVSVGTALAPYASNPTQTAASGADTQYKFGAGGTTSFNHVSGQNNSAVNAYIAFDQSTTISGNEVYVVAPGQAFSFDRSGVVLHFSSPSQISFGGQSGLTVEAFA